jgi:hypothetical protein
METNGIKTTFPYEAISPGVARHQCEECGRWERSDKGPIAHSRSCQSRRQVVAAVAPQTDTRNTVADEIRRTSLRKDADVLELVRSKRLSVDDAMNTDD